MFFSQRDKEEKKEKLRVYKVNTKKPVIAALWILYASGFGFAVYKNFTAIDTHTIHETKVIEERVLDTHAIENFVSNFAKIYYAWEQTEDSITDRERMLGFYLTPDLQRLNSDMIRKDIPVKSTVSEVQVWSINSEDSSTYHVVFTVNQRISNGETEKTVISVYEVSVFVDEGGNMVITRNPSICNKPGKSEYVPKQVEMNGSLEAATMAELNEFLESFFHLYPNATEKELSYYVKNNALPAIGRAYLFAELINPVYVKEGEEIKALVSVKYLDEQTNMTLISQFELTLEKIDENWKIVD